MKSFNLKKGIIYLKKNGRVSVRWSVLNFKPYIVELPSLNKKTRLKKRHVK